MSQYHPSWKHSSRLSTPVRLGVAAVSACFIASPVLANPSNPTVVNGVATFKQAGNVLTVTNSNGAIINWDRFSIKAGETTRFEQPSASSTVMNRVLNDPSVIYGTLWSNGRVWLINPSGVMVGPGGRIDTAGFVASTLGVSNENFLAGRRLFVNEGVARDVINQGEIRTPAGGSVYLIGSKVTNEGIITTPRGETILAAGATVSLIDSALPGVKVYITGAAGNATNLGDITAEAGRIGIAGVIVRNGGTLNASSVVSEGGRVFLKASQDVTVDGAGRIVASGTRGGEITVEAGDIASIRGRLEAEGSRGSGGAIDLFGDKVGLFGNAYVDASGALGGGSLRVGGDYQGANAGVRNASFTYLGQNATLKAGATGRGDGGRVIVWADDTTRAYGSISAQGGLAGGDGGFVEVSGKQNLDFLASVSVGARGPGAPGTLLLDPKILWIADFGGFLPQVGGFLGAPVGVDPTPSPFAAVTTGIAVIRPASLDAVKGNISLAATKDLLIDDPITLTTAGAGLTATAGKLLVVTPGSTITTSNGAVSLTGGTVAAPTSADKTDFPLAGNGTCTSGNCYANGSLLVMAPISTGGGALSLNANLGNLYLKDSVTSSGGAMSLHAASSIFSRSSDQPVSGATYSHIASMDSGTGSLNLSASSLSLEGSIAGSGGITMAATTISNSGAINGGGGSLSLSATNLSNYGSIAASGGITMAATGGSLYSPGSINGGSGSLKLSGSALQFYGSIAASGGITMMATSYINNQAATNFGAGSAVFSAPSYVYNYNLTGSGPVSATSPSGYIYLVSNTGGLQVVNASTAGGVEVSAAGDLLVANAAGSSVELSAAGNLQVATASAGGGLSLSAAGNVLVGNISGSNVSLDSASSGIISGIDAASKVTGTSSVVLNTSGSAGRIGSAALPLVVDTTQLVLSTDSTVNIQFPTTPTRTLSYLDLNLDATGLGTTSSIAEGPVLGSGLTLSSTGSLVNASINPTTALGTFRLRVNNGGLTIPTITNAGNMTLRSDGALSIAAATGGGSSSFSATSFGSTVGLGTVSGVGSVSVSAASGITVGSVIGTSANMSTTSGNIVAAGPAATYEIDVGTGSVSLTASGGSIGGSDSFDIRSGNASLTAGAGSIGSVSKPVVLNSNANVTINASGTFNVVGKDAADTLLSFNRLTLNMRAEGMGAGSSIVSANFPLSDFVLNTFNPVSDGTTITLPDLKNHSFTSGLFLTVTDPSSSGLGNVALGQVEAALGSFSLTAPGSVTQASEKIVAMGSKAVTIDAGGALSLGDVTSGTTSLTSYGGIVLGNAIISSLVASAATNLTATSVAATGSVTLRATSGDLSIGTVTGSFLNLSAGNTLTAMGDLTATDSIIAAATNASSGAISVGKVTSTGSYLDLRAGNSLNATGDLTGLGHIIAKATNATSGAISVGKVTSTGTGTDSYLDLSAGNTLTATGDLTAARYIKAAATNATSGAISVGKVTSTGTGTDSYLNFSAGNTLTATGDLTAASYIIAAANNPSSGAITVGNVTSTGSYLDLSAGSTLTAGNLTSATNNISAEAGAALLVGNVTAPSTRTVTLFGDSITLSRASNAYGGNIGTLEIYSTQAFTDANVLDSTNGLKANNLTIQANAASGYGIDLATTPVVATTANLEGGNGDIRANLTGTTGLTLSTNGSFNVTTSAPALSNLNISGNAAGIGASTLTGTSLQTFSFGHDTDLAVSTTAFSPLNLTMNVNGLAGNKVVLSSSSTYGGSVTINANDGGIGLSNVSTYGGSVTADAYAGGLTASNLDASKTSSIGGDIDLYAAGGLGASSVTTSNTRTVNLATDGGNLEADGITGGPLVLRAGSGSISATNLLGTGTSLTAYLDVTLGSVSTTHASASGGALDVVSYAGSILNPSDSFLNVGTAAVTLQSYDGSVGSTEHPMAIQTSGALSELNLLAREDMAVNVKTGSVLANVARLGVTFNGLPSASPVLEISANNLPAAFLMRTETSDVTVGGGSTPGLTNLSVVNDSGPLTLAGDLGGLATLTLQSGGDLAINGNIAATSLVTLDAGNDLMIAASGGPRTVSSSSFNLSAGGAIQLLAGASAGESLAVTATSRSTVTAGGDILVNGAVGGATISTGGGGLEVSGRDFWVRSGSGGARVNSGYLELTSNPGGSYGVRIEAEQAPATVSSGTYQYVYASNGISVLGGLVAGAAAALSASTDQYLYQYYGGIGAITVAGGSASGASALISAGRHQNVDSYDGLFSGLDVTAGNAANAFGLMSADTSQYIQVGNSGIHLTAKAFEGASAELWAVSGQQINPGSGGFTLTGGSSANPANPTYARIRNSTSSSQNVFTDGGIALLGGGANSITNITGSGLQYVTGAAITLQGGGADSTTGITGNGSQTVSGPVITLLGGGADSTTSITNSGSGPQTVSGGTISLASAPASSGTNLVAIDAAGFQKVSATGALTIYNDYGPGAVRIKADGGQTIKAPSIDVRIGAANANTTSKASIEAGGSQDVEARSLLSVAALGMGTASVETAGAEQFLTALTFSPTGAAPTGNVIVGDATAQGTSRILSSHASGSQEIEVGGNLSVLSGIGASKIDAAGSQVISVLAGSLTVNGGSGSASIDPVTQTIFVNGAVSLNHASISGDTSRLVLTQGNLTAVGATVDSSNLLWASAGDFTADASSSFATTGKIFYRDGGSYANSGTVAPGITVEKIPVYGSSLVALEPTPPPPPTAPLINALNDAIDSASTSTTPIDSDTPPESDKPEKDKKASCTEGSLGCDEEQTKDGKKDDKPVAKKLAQCS